MDIYAVASCMGKILTIDNKRYEIYGADVGFNQCFFAVNLDSEPIDGNIYQSLDCVRIKFKEAL